MFVALPPHGTRIIMDVQSADMPSRLDHMGESQG